MTDLVARQYSRPVKTDEQPKSKPETNSTDPKSYPNSPAILLWSIWFGLLSALIELGLLFALKPLRDPAPGLFRMNRHVFWIIPLDNMVVFGGCGCLLALAAGFWPRLASRLAPRLLSFLAILTLLVSIRPLFAWAGLILACALAPCLGCCLLKRSQGFHRLVRVSLPILAVVVLGLAGSSFHKNVMAAGSIGRGLPSATAGAPNVLLIVLDTVRADRLSVYGYGRDTTPNLKRLARDGVRFERARSTAPWTLPSHASMFTGRWPHQLSADLDGPLDATYPTIAEFLGSQGYDTAGFVANLTYTSAETGLSRGFAHYEDHRLLVDDLIRGSALGSRIVWETVAAVGHWTGHPVPNFTRKNAEEVNGQFLGWLSKRPTDRPFFAFVNYYDAHNPYVPPLGFNRHFGVRRETAADNTTIERWFVLDKHNLTPRQVGLINDGYDDCIAYLDEHLGRLFDSLEQRGVLQNTLVIVTADHGEAFGDHELYGHASSLYDSEIHVPLLIMGPRGVPRGLSAPASATLRDLPATIADLLGHGSRSPFPGVSMARHWADPSTLANTPAGTLFSEVEKPAHSLPNQGRSPVFRGAMKLLVSNEKIYIRNGDGVEELYDIANDPHQKQNLSDSKVFQEEMKKFRDSLQDLLKREPPCRPLR